MADVDYLIVGAGVTGLAFANFLASDDYLIIERDRQPGGYCKTIRQEGFTWDYSGHFFHFRNAAIEDFLLARLPSDAVVRVHKCAAIHYRGQLIDYPFQKNIHQLAKPELIDCLYHLYFRECPQGVSGFKAMLYERFGQGIAERFLVPYNEKLLATDLSSLHPAAMGRFFPAADVGDIIRNFKSPDNISYNSTFTYPRGGACQYIEALLRDLDGDRLSFQESLERVDLQARVAITNRREITFRFLISSAPFTTMLECVGEAEAAAGLSASKVLAVNLGFDAKGNDRLHWVYFPERKYPFYRVGYYDNVVLHERMSLYVECGFNQEVEVDFAEALQGILDGLAEAGVVTTQNLICHHHVLMDPAYVHITPESLALYERFHREWRARGVYSIGRYGGWRYCSMEDNIEESRLLAAEIGP